MHKTCESEKHRKNFCKILQKCCHPDLVPLAFILARMAERRFFLDSSGLFVTERVFQWRTSPPHTVMSSAEDSPSAPSEEHPVSSDRDTQTDFMITRIISDATLLSSLRSALGVEGQTNASAPNSSSTDNEGLQAQSVQGNRPVEGTRKNSGQPARHVTLNIEKSTLGQPTRHVTEEPVEQPPRHATNMNAESADYDYCRILYCLVTLYTIFLVILYTSRNFSLSYNNTTIRIVFLGIPAAVLATCTYGIPQSSL